MNIFSKYLKSIMALSMVLFAAACSEDDPAPIPFDINFTNTEVGISSTSNSVEVNITFSRPSEVAGKIELSINPRNLVYGKDADFFTAPELVNQTITLPFEIGQENVSFKVTSGSALNIKQNETIIATLTQKDKDGFNLGGNTVLTLTFSENFIAPSGTIELDAGGASFSHQAFVDLSKLQQSTVNKYSWDLGFYSASGEHKVIVNNSAYVMAQAIDKTNIDEVVSADTLGFASQMKVSIYTNPAAANYIDDQNGNLDQTAFGTIAATDSENKVFIVKRDGDNRNWKKVRILQNGDNYTLQYADIASTSHTSVTISKDAAYNFSFFDLDNGAATVEPEKESWDIMYGTYANRANFGSILPIGFKDFVVVNRTDVSAAMVSTQDFTFESFSTENLSSVTLTDDDISVIGSSWRKLVNFSLVLKDDVFYVIKDGEGNHYKLKFNRLKSTSGERGKPEFTFELLN